MKFSKLVPALMLFIICWSFISMAQSASPVPASSPVAVISAPSAAPAAGSGVMGWISAHGGFQAAVLLLVFSANAILSAVRDVMKKWDGINPGDAIPAANTKLTLVNRICMILGQVIDYVQGNVQH